MSIQHKISFTKISVLIFTGFIFIYVHELYAIKDEQTQEKSLHKAPVGYSWKQCEKIKTNLLLPDGWHFKEEEKGETKAVFVTKESIDKGGVFETGFSINAIPNLSKKRGMAPSKFAEFSIANIKAITQSWAIKPVNYGICFKGYSGYFRSKSPVNMVIQFTIFLGNDKSGTFYIITFESPETEWKQAWGIGAPIIDNLTLDPQF